MSRIFRTGAATLCALALASPAAQATEGGVSLYPHGAEGYMTAVVPPPGLYGLVYGTHYSADRLKGNDGKDLGIPGFRVKAQAVVGRLAWVPGTKLLGGDLVAQVVVPLVHLQVSAAGARQSKSGIGDLTAGMGLGYHHSPNLHSVVALDVFLPTGSYAQADLANIGKNHWGLEPIYALSYVDPKGFNGDLKLSYTVNGRNRDTRYRSGNEFHADYAAGWGLGNGWTLGVGGYYLQQLTDDRQAGAVVAGNRGRAMSLGPNIKYDSGQGWFATVKWEKEFNARNRAQGQALWLKGVFPL